MKILSFIMSAITAICFFFSSFPALFQKTSTAVIDVDTSSSGDVIPNVVDNINVWHMGTQFYNAQRNEENDVFEFVKYVQLMQCTGGTPDRDLFVDPYNTSTLTDYKFDSLIENCRGILNLGAKPHLKLGGVPLKFTKDFEMGDFDMNVYPPDDFNAYYTYIRAIAQALVDEFGIQEVKTWRFGVMTEYENAQWFQAKSGLPEDAAEAYCKLYDYTVQALIDVIGEDVFVGAHSMTVTEGLWDEEIFIRHVAEGTNYANGKKGSRICFLSASFYDACPGEFTSGYTLPETIGYLKDKAQKYGLDNLIFGIDEGRILSGTVSGADDSQLLNRTVGFTWQAAYDARIFAQTIRAGGDYFSSWNFLTNGNLDGYPIISYHVAENIAKFEGCRILSADTMAVKTSLKTEIGNLVAIDEETGMLRAMVYNFKNDLDYKGKADITLNIPAEDGKKYKVTRYLVSDDCNYFDEWQEDRKKYNITDDCFAWSPDDPMIDSGTTLRDPEAREIYYTQLREKYKECAVLTPEVFEATANEGELSLNITLEAGNVVFFEIEEI
ncbi:MAG: hypothetical protein E7555_09735 [Ruminococcaceae bacterium]|nr:hypothetical protein [Oscillospiraceae bacterium]